MKNDFTNENSLLKDYMDIFNKYLLSFNYEKMSLGLFNGIIGNAIYLYYQERYFQQSAFGDKASQLIDLLYSKLEEGVNTSIEDGFIGIGLGLHYLISYNFVKGNVNNILSECDDYIFKSLVKLQTVNQEMTLYEALSMLYHIFYFTIRLKSKKLNKSSRFLFQHLICQTVNNIENNYSKEKYEEPLLFSPFSYFLPLYIIILERIQNLGFFNVKVERIYEELSDKIQSQIPLHGSHKYFMGNILLSIQRKSIAQSWKFYAQKLFDFTDINQVIEKEFGNRNLSINNGLCGFIWLMKLYNQEKLIPNLVFKKIEKAKIWDDFLNAPYEEKYQYIGLFTGLEGIIITYQNLIR